MKFILATALPLLCFCTGCSHLERISCQEFISKIETPMTTMSSNQYIGTGGGRAYMEHWQKGLLFGNHTDVLWTPIDEFPPEMAKKLHHHENPWGEQKPSRDDLHL